MLPWAVRVPEARVMASHCDAASCGCHTHEARACLISCIPCHLETRLGLERDNIRKALPPGPCCASGQRTIPRTIPAILLPSGPVQSTPWPQGASVIRDIEEERQARACRSRSHISTSPTLTGIPASCPTPATSRAQQAPSFELQGGPLLLLVAESLHNRCVHQDGLVAALRGRCHHLVQQTVEHARVICLDEVPNDLCKETTIHLNLLQAELGKRLLPHVLIERFEGNAQDPDDGAIPVEGNLGKDLQLLRP
mmetsp:Transcript_133568/g.372369  ORF Transcript_133568/g.372369 Transcript_133568/m.372369 type:complete len:253 (-) Transcript_133568:614-1372(-)